MTIKKTNKVSVADFEKARTNAEKLLKGLEIDCEENITIGFLAAQLVTYALMETAERQKAVAPIWKPLQDLYIKDIIRGIKERAKSYAD